MPTCCYGSTPSQTFPQSAELVFVHWCWAVGSCSPDFVSVLHTAKAENLGRNLEASWAQSRNPALEPHFWFNKVVQVDVEYTDIFCYLSDVPWLHTRLDHTRAHLSNVVSIRICNYMDVSPVSVLHGSPIFSSLSLLACAHGNAAAVSVKINQWPIEIHQHTPAIIGWLIHQSN